MRDRPGILGLCGIGLGLLLALAYGCSDDAIVGVSPSPAGMDGGCAANGAVVTLGNGTNGSLDNFRPLNGTDNNVYLIAGPQGGRHIWIALRATGIDPAQPRVQLQAIRVSDGVLIGLIRVRLPMSLVPGTPPEYGLPSQQLFIDDDKYCSVLMGDVRVVLDFDDFAGHCVHEETVVHVMGFDPNGNPADTAAQLGCCTFHQPRCFPSGFDAGSFYTDATVTDATAMGP